VSAPTAGSPSGGLSLDQLAALRGKRALVVGAGFGIGRAIARLLADLGVQLAVVDREPARVQALVEELGAIGIEQDVLEPGAAEVVIAQSRERLGELDLLVNVVGKGEIRSATELTAAAQQAQFSMNYLHQVEFCAAFANACIESGRPGSAVVVSSLAGEVPIPGRASYGAAKAALGSFVANLALEVARFGIRVNGVAPGVIRTDRNPISAEDEVEFARAIPLGRVATQTEIATAVAFLASDLASFVTGQMLIVDGGASRFIKMWPDAPIPPRP
jgi:NAD(P)-dependent dehydrogenase (short-subunit alcohol dehydrogenase family)